VRITRKAKDLDELVKILMNKNDKYCSDDVKKLSV